MTADWIDRAAAERDEQAFQTLLEDHYAYLHASGFGQELPGLLADALRGAPERQDRGEWAQALQGVLSRSVDGHARVREFRPLPGAIPALMHVSGDRVVAVRPDRSGFLLPDFPFLTAIDGLGVEAWLAQVGTLVAGSGASWRRERTVSGLHLIQQSRRRLGRPETDTATLTLSDGTGSREVQVPVVPERPEYGVWPAPQSRWIGDVGYLRLPAMTPRAAPEIARWLPEFGSARGLIVDVRGNPGGMRDVFLPLLRALLPREAGPRVVNVAASRQLDAEGAERLAGRHLHPVDGPHWTDAERAAVAETMSTFRPTWTPPAESFSGWYAQVVHPAAPDEPRVTCPVVVLTDGQCFSATDIFLSGVQGLPGVTLLGETSGGGSGSPRVHALPSGLQFRVASMASFRPSGELIEGHGSVVDVRVPAAPESFLAGGMDNVLQAALSGFQFH
ncbi:hypothetical protein DEIGR_100864 [Deinococcus grandis]|uniref:Tail specific protease domain-containing protein n=1 Tax=Deinococcus grandis TaxID=57498 RepID=A0A117DMZ8_9DEIO|nr:S41 family peptidase [Deinococcus grandis]BBN95676.1 hypothetical protein DEGR_24090 [Deinococcus grandis]GAQ20837.1 hypothetical protein DEIGR_100864 [Deinococcus grandis]